MSTANPSTFLVRFERIWAQARRVQLLQALCWAVLTALAGVALLAAADYLLELPQTVRSGALLVIAVASFAVAVSLAVQSVRRWRRQATAAAIEQVFPQLGQRIRTTVQYGTLSTGERERAGVATTLVAALEDDTVRRAQPLPLDAVVPWKSLAMTSLLAAVVGLSLAGASAFDWQWRAAARRAFLGNVPYTRITVTPGDLTLKEGESAMVHVAVEGRTGNEILFWSRRCDDDSPWEPSSLALDDAEQTSDRQWEFDVPLERVRYPLEYRVAAGSTSSETYRVNVLYPLKLVNIETAVQPPEYTGLGEQLSESGNITGLVGSQVRLQLELDRAPESAWLELQPLHRRAATEVEVSKVPLLIEGTRLTARFEITADQAYSIIAKAADGMELPENKYRIRARQDEPPQVWFESPSEALEVHTLAEVLMRARVNDDFGLTRAGIMFEMNNEEEYPLLVEDFAAAANELRADGRLSPRTRATLEKVLPLEHFELTQQDSVLYYAFAEDNRPGTAQRTESDLRFIDIRPFKRLYRVVDPEDGMLRNQGPQLKTLEELIARQRYALNRTIQLARRLERTGQADVAGVDSLIKFEAELAKSTRELAEGLEARGIDDTELLYQAETAMLGAADSLNAGKYDTATLQQRDALKFLIEGRNRLQIAILKNPNRQLLAQLRQFDRMQRQKLRRPKTDEEEAREVAERLADLAEREEFVYHSLAGILMPSGTNQPSEAEGGSSDSEEPKKPPEENEDRSEGDSGTPSRRELEDRQLDIALESREVEKVLGRLKGVTDLAKERIAEAAKAAEETAAALGQGDVPEAKRGAGSAEKQFRELSEQVKALLAQEQAERIAAAQQMAAQLARQQQDFADRLAKAGQQAGGGNPPEDDKEQPGAGEQRKPQEKQDNPMPGLGGQAEEIAEKAKTLNDVLGTAGKANDPRDQAAAQKVREIVGALQLADLAQRLQDLPTQISSGRWQEARTMAGDGAERLEAAAERLSVLHRSIVTPRIDELAKLEEKLTVLDTELDRLEAPSEIAGWHLKANDLLDELDKAGLTDELRKEFLEEMRKAGWGPTMTVRGWSWGRIDGGYYQAPVAYHRLISRMVASVRDHIQELMLGDLAYSRDEPIPPQYQEFVDRYYQVLASEGKGMKTENRNTKAEAKSKP